MSCRNDQSFLLDIIHAAKTLMRYVEEVTYEKYVASELLQDATLRKIEVIGEASRNLSDDLKERHNELPWHQMIGIRNRVIHGYFDVNLETVWGVITKEIPEILPVLESLVKSLEKDDDIGH